MLTQIGGCHSLPFVLRGIPVDFALIICIALRERDAGGKYICNEDAVLMVEPHGIALFRLIGLPASVQNLILTVQYIIAHDIRGLEDILLQFCGKSDALAVRFRSVLQIHFAE